ncbi:hypothetical protein HDU90_005733 [Geranomyces variabilis]|nr:hypothetical protein HDU90_005733 [Geranomyces variabilis]
MITICPWPALVPLRLGGPGLCIPFFAVLVHRAVGPTRGSELAEPITCGQCFRQLAPATHRHTVRKPAASPTGKPQATGRLLSRQQQQQQPKWQLQVPAVFPDTNSALDALLNPRGANGQFKAKGIEDLFLPICEGEAKAAAKRRQRIYELLKHNQYAPGYVAMSVILKESRPHARKRKPSRSAADGGELLI